MAIEIGNFIRIYRDPTTETGLSALEGAEVQRVEDLPEHLVEVHVFSDNTYATTFMEGIQLVGIGNSMAVTRQFGNTHTNQVVLVARFDEPRRDGETPLDCLKVVHHERDHEPDTRARKEWMDNHHREENKRYQRQAALAEAEAGPVVERLRAAGFKAELGGSYADSSSVRAHRPAAGRWASHADDTFGISVPHVSGDATVTVSGYSIVQGDIDLRDRYREIAASHGVTFEPEGRGDSDFQATCGRDASACLEAVGALEACLAECKQAKKAAYDAVFRAGMKVTAARRRLFAAGRDGGVHQFVNRGSQKARAGGEEIGPSEIAALKRMGWLEDGPDRKLLVTDAALEAAGLARDAVDAFDSSGPRTR